MSDQLAGVLVGGLLAAAVSTLLFVATEWRSRGEWRRQAQLEASREAVSALQHFNREITNLAISTADSVDGDSPQFSALHEATTQWNVARYKAALISPRPQIEHLDALDKELDRLLDLSRIKQWTSTGFRAERELLGRLGAQYVREARAAAREGEIEWASLWTWA